ncbi:MAG: ArsR/SmtB family transcription factor [Bacillota bacterium]
MPEKKLSQGNFAELAKALGHQNRVEIIKFLARQPENDKCMVGDIVEELPIAQATVSQHLKILKKAGWIIGQVNGPRTCYCLNKETVGEFQKLFDHLLS